MSAEPMLNVVLYWHMHQPEYRDTRSGEFQLPWTYLHTIKDYADMAAHLENNPDAKAVINFVPILLEQIAAYDEQIQLYLNNTGVIKDSLLDALISPALPAHPERRMELVHACLRANRDRLINRYDTYRRLADFARLVEKVPETIKYLSDQYLIDLLVWYHLAWLGEHSRRHDSRVKKLIKKGEHYNLHDRRVLLEVIGELIHTVIPRYRALAERGQIELSMTPYAHPITPLLLDIQSAREAIPNVNLPGLQTYPGGYERAKWHIDHGLDSFEHFFGIRPAGCWPAEGSISNATLDLLAEYDFKWAASGGGVLDNSLSTANQERPPCIHRPYRHSSSGIQCFFRDDGLSDLIGFNYSDWHADDAVANLVHNLENIAAACKDTPDNTVSIILDGENAWEYYPENGYYFLQALYQQLADHPQLNLCTYSDCLASNNESIALQNITAGSWVYGSFSTWIGDSDKNRAWDMLGDAKKMFDQVIESQQPDSKLIAKAEQQLALCEGSDWFWWFGDYNPSGTVSDFDRLYRINLSRLYQILGKEPPAYLAEVISHGSGDPAMGGTMRPGQASTS